MTSILSLILQLAGISTQRVTERVAGLSVLFVLSLVFLLLGLVGLAAALWIWLAQLVGPLLAALIMGSVCLILSAILLMVAKSRSNTDHILYGRKVRPESPAPDSALVVLPLAAIALIGFALRPRKPKR